MTEEVCLKIYYNLIENDTDLELTSVSLPVYPKHKFKLMVKPSLTISKVKTKIKTTCLNLTHLYQPDTKEFKPFDLLYYQKTEQDLILNPEDRLSYDLINFEDSKSIKDYSSSNHIRLILRVKPTFFQITLYYSTYNTSPPSLHTLLPLLTSAKMNPLTSSNSNSNSTSNSTSNLNNNVQFRSKPFSLDCPICNFPAPPCDSSTPIQHYLVHLPPPTVFSPSNSNANTTIITTITTTTTTTAPVSEEAAGSNGNGNVNNSNSNSRGTTPRSNSTLLLPTNGAAVAAVHMSPRNLNNSISPRNSASPRKLNTHPIKQNHVKKHHSTVVTSHGSHHHSSKDHHSSVKAPLVTLTKTLYKLYNLSITEIYQAELPYVIHLSPSSSSAASASASSSSSSSSSSSKSNSKRTSRSSISHNNAVNYVNPNPNLVLNPNCQYLYRNRKIPYIIKRLFDFLCEPEHLAIEGLFRINSSQALLTKLTNLWRTLLFYPPFLPETWPQCDFDQGKGMSVIGTQRVYLILSWLKDWMTKLKNTVLRTELIKVMKENTESWGVEEVRRVMYGKGVSIEEREFVWSLMEYMECVAKEPDSKMDAKGIGRTMTVILFTCTNGPDTDGAGNNINNNNAAASTTEDDELEKVLKGGQVIEWLINNWRAVLIEEKEKEKEEATNGSSSTNHHNHNHNHHHHNHSRRTEDRSKRRSTSSTGGEPFKEDKEKPTKEILKSHQHTRDHKRGPGPITGAGTVIGSPSSTPSTTTPSTTTTTTTTTTTPATAVDDYMDNSFRKRSSTWDFNDQTMIHPNNPNNPIPSSSTPSSSTPSSSTPTVTPTVTVTNGKEKREGSHHRRRENLIMKK